MEDLQTYLRAMHHRRLAPVVRPPWCTLLPTLGLTGKPPAATSRFSTTAYGSPLAVCQPDSILRDFGPLRAFFSQVMETARLGAQLNHYHDEAWQRNALW